MTKTLMLALSLGVLVGCAEEAPADVETTDVEVLEPAEPVTEPTDDLMEDELTDDEAMMEGDAGLDETMDDDMEGDAVMDEEMEAEVE